MATTVPMSHPATAVKNSDGTWSVRIQHTTEGSVTTVDFTNVLFAEVLAKAYANVLNDKAVVEAKLGQLATDLAPAVADVKADIKAGIADADAEAQRIISNAVVEAGKIKDDAKTLAASIKTEASTLKTEAVNALSAAKTEAEKLLAEARTEAARILNTVAEKVQPPPPATEKPATKPTVATKPVEDE